MDTLGSVPLKDLVRQMSDSAAKERRAMLRAQVAAKKAEFASKHPIQPLREDTPGEGPSTSIPSSGAPESYSGFCSQFKYDLFKKVVVDGETPGSSSASTPSMSSASSRALLAAPRPSGGSPSSASTSMSTSASTLPPTASVSSAVSSSLTRVIASQVAKRNSSGELESKSSVSEERDDDGGKVEEGEEGEEEDAEEDPLFRPMSDELRARHSGPLWETLPSGSARPVTDPSVASALLGLAGLPERSTGGPPSPSTAFGRSTFPGLTPLFERDPESFPSFAQFLKMQAGEARVSEVSDSDEEQEDSGAGAGAGAVEAVPGQIPEVEIDTDVDPAGVVIPRGSLAGRINLSGVESRVVLNTLVDDDDDDDEEEEEEEEEDDTEGDAEGEEAKAEDVAVEVSEVAGGASEDGVVSLVGEEEATPVEPF